VTVGKNSDVGAGSSIMGTLSAAERAKILSGSEAC
jgi:tetrahydrodipicolinate N-succinyltransferase